MHKEMDVRGAYSVEHELGCYRGESHPKPGFCIADPADDDNPICAIPAAPMKTMLLST